MVLKNKIIACACLLGVFVYGNATSAPKASRDTSAVQLAVDALKVNLKNPVEGIDTNILSMAEKIVDNATSGVTVKLIAVKNPQISSNGDITYGENDVTGRVTFQLNKNRSKLKQVFTITVPKKIEAVDPNIADVQAGKDALTNLVLEVGEEDNVITLVQQKVDAVVSGVEVTILQSENSQVSLDGEVTCLVGQEVIGNVTFKLTKGDIIDFVLGGVTVKPGLELGFDPVVGGYNVKSYGAVGNGVIDDTVAINNLITTVSNAGGGIIYVPSGNYLINTSGYSGILMKSNVDLILHDNATLVEKDSSQYNTAVVRFRGIENASITGGKIYGKRRFHVGDSNEWDHGIAIQGSNLIDVKGVYIYDCWGDGICLADNPSGLSYSSNVTIDGVTCDNNCRQGLSVTSGLRSTIIKNSIFSNSHHDTSLSGPNDGIDIEPNDPLKAPYLELTIDNCQFINNGRVGLPATLGGYGISCAFGRSYWHSDAWNIVIKNCTGYGNTNGLTSAWCGYRNNVTIIDSNFNKTPLTSYTNMFSNPTFSPDITGWTLSGATFNSSASGVATVTPTGNTVYLRQTVANSITGHKYYYSMDVKATASTLATIKPSVSTGTIFPGGHADGAAGALAGRGTNYWFKVGGITKCTAGGTNTCTTTVTYSAFSGTLQFRNPRCIDLTALFGSGNEPSDAECYELFF